MNPNPVQPQYGGPYQPPPQPQGCWGRNWKWLVPTGCFGLFVLVVAAVAAIFFFAVSAVKSSEVYRRALEKARNDQAVISMLGQPVSDGLLVQGSIETTMRGEGHAKFQVPLSGPKNSGTLYVVALKVRDLYRDDDWHFETLEVEVTGQPGRINLLQGTEETDGDESVPPPPPAPPTAPSSTRAPVSGGVLNGKAISKPEPPYPPIAKAAKASGTVAVAVTVDESGNVVSATAISGHPLLQQAAVAAARQAKFTPYQLDGSPVKVKGVLTYNFVPE
jgi:TonB family protein